MLRPEKVIRPIESSVERVNFLGRGPVKEVQSAKLGSVFAGGGPRGVRFAVTTKTESGRVTQAHRDEYQELGCVRVEGVFSQAWIDTVLAGSERVLQAFRAGTQPPVVFDHPGNITPTCYDHPGNVQMNGIAGCALEFRDWIHDSPAAETVADLIGADYVRFWVDALFMKQGSAPNQATPWHNDECTYGFVGEQIPSLWMALTDVSEDNAPLITLAGSNHDPHRYHSTFSPQDIERPEGFRPWQELLDRVSADDADIRVWPAKAGDVLLIHPKTIHASHPRAAASDGFRAAYSTRWLGSDPIWRPNALSLPLPYLPADALKVGEPPPDEYFPKVWQRL